MRIGLSDETLESMGKKKMNNVCMFKDYLIEQAKEDFDVYWWIQKWIDEKWDEFNE